MSEASERPRAHDQPGLVALRRLRCLGRPGESLWPAPFSPIQKGNISERCGRLSGGASRPAPLGAAAAHVARARPFRACGHSRHRPRPFRAEMDVPSPPALLPFRSRTSGGFRDASQAPPRDGRGCVAGETGNALAARSRPVAARCWLGPRTVALSLAPVGRSRRRERERRCDWSGGVVKIPRWNTGCRALVSAFVDCNGT
jgi:hypothetical protein